MACLENKVVSMALIKVTILTICSEEAHKCLRIKLIYFQVTAKQCMISFVFLL